MVPAMLGKSEWLSLVRGVVQRPQMATCNANEYDFFVVCQHLDGVVAGTFLINDAGLTPHSPVRLGLRGGSPGE